MSAEWLVVFFSIRVSQVFTRRDPIANTLLEFDDVGESTFGFAGPYERTIGMNFENSAFARF